MALIKCPECGSKISDKATACPSCGYPIKNKSEKSNIKLVPAKCPSCGANIEVDSNSNKTKCEYCHTTILIDDAIQRLEVEIKNLPKLDSILKIADKHYSNNQFQEAYELYSNASLLDPNNPFVNLRKGVCKYIISDSIERNDKVLLNCFEESIKAEKDEEKRNVLLIEIMNTAQMCEIFARNLYNMKSDSKSDIDELYSVLLTCSLSYELVSIYLKDEENIRICYNNIVLLCNELLKEPFYEVMKNGKKIRKRYSLPINQKNEIDNTRKKYLVLLEKLDSNLANKLDKSYNKIMTDNVSNGRLLLLIISMLALIFFIPIGEPLIVIILLAINTITLIKPIHTKIYKGYSKLGLFISILILAFCLIYYLSWMNNL